MPWAAPVTTATGPHRGAGRHVGTVRRRDGAGRCGVVIVGGWQSPGSRRRCACATGLPDRRRRRHRRARAGRPARRQAAHRAARSGQPVETGAETFLMRDRGGESAALGAGPAGRPRRRRWSTRRRCRPRSPCADGLHPMPGRHAAGRTGRSVHTGRTGPRRRRRRRPRRAAAAPARTSRSARWCARGSATRWWTGSSTRCSAGCTPAGPTTCRSPPRCPALHRRPRDAAPRWPPPCGPRSPPRPGRPAQPVFATVRGGLSRAGRGGRGDGRAPRCGSARPVRELHPYRRRRGGSPSGPTRDPRPLDADAVILAVPAAPGRPAARAGRPDRGRRGRGARLRERGAGHAGPAGGHRAARAVRASWCRRRQGYAVKAATFFTTKWPHLRRRRRGAGPGLARPLRRGARCCSAPTTAWSRWSARELAGARSAPLPEPVAARVNRWGGALPQYGVGPPGPGRRGPGRAAAPRRAGRGRLRRGRHRGLRTLGARRRPMRVWTAEPHRVGE